MSDTVTRETDIGAGMPAWHDRALLDRILSGNPDAAAAAQAELDRRRAAAEARSQKFRERRVAGMVRDFRESRRRRRELRARAANLVAASLLVVLIAAALLLN